MTDAQQAAQTAQEGLAKARLRLSRYTHKGEGKPPEEALKLMGLRRLKPEYLIKTSVNPAIRQITQDRLQQREYYARPLRQEVANTLNTQTRINEAQFGGLF